MAEIEECKHYGIDPKIVERFEKRIERLLRDMDKYGLSLFCGSAGTIRADDFYEGMPLVVGHIRGTNHDGGDGGVSSEYDGLQRGE